jgi:hypothetical protein
MNREEWEIELEKRKILQESITTEYKKNNFIREINEGLGERIKKELNPVKQKPSIWNKIKVLIGWN